MSPRNFLCLSFGLSTCNDSQQQKHNYANGKENYFDDRDFEFFCAVSHFDHLLRGPCTIISVLLPKLLPTAQTCPPARICKTISSSGLRGGPNMTWPIRASNVP